MSGALQGGHAEAEAADLPSRGLLSFYDRLRERIEASCERRAGAAGGAAARLLLLAPDVFILLLRLSLDREVPAETRRFLAGAVAYFVLPVDLLPEAFVGPVGFLDDLVLAAAVLSRAFGEELEPVAAKHWNGSGGAARTLGEVSRAAHALLGEDLYARLERLLRRRGVPLAG